MRVCMAALAVLAFALTCRQGEKAMPSGKEEAGWSRGLPADPSFFPISVWSQDVKFAQDYKALGVNVYVGATGGLPEKQLELLKAAGVKLITGLSERWLKYKEERTIVGWMHGDEPDLVRPLAADWGQALQGRDVKYIIDGDVHGGLPPTHPRKLRQDYFYWRTIDPTRPVYLNLSNGVALKEYNGRGIRSAHPEDYAEYIKGCDIASYDIYPVNTPDPKIDGNLWYVALGVENLIKWSGRGQKVWCWIECTDIGSRGGKYKPTPAQVKAEVWMALTHGADGFGYFCHIFDRKGVCTTDHGCLDDPEMKKAMGEINLQVLTLAPVLNSPTVTEGAQVTTDSQVLPVKALVKKHQGATFVFAVGMRAGTTTATFTIPGVTGSATAQVLGEDRSRPAPDGIFQDAFGPYAVHLYKITHN